MKFQSSKRAWFAMNKYMKKLWKMLNIYYQIPISAISPLKLKIK